MDNTGGVIADDFSPTDQQKLLRSLVMSLFLYLSANDMAVCPPPVTACTLILPCFSNARTTAVLPKMVAKCRGFICPLNMFGFASSRQYPYTTGCVKGGFTAVITRWMCTVIQQLGYNHRVVPNRLNRGA